MIFFRRRTCKPGRRLYAPTRTNDHVSDAPGDQRVCSCWPKRHPHCTESWLLNLDCTQMATTIHALGPCRLQIADGSSDHWSVSRPFPKELQETILHLRKLHPGWGPNTLLATLKMDGYWRNQHLPSRALSHQAPLEAYPHAMHSGRMYRPEWEEDLLCLESVWTYLRACRWFRRIRTNGFFCLGGYSYYLINRELLYLFLILLLLS